MGYRAPRAGRSPDALWRSPLAGERHSRPGSAACAALTAILLTCAWSRAGETPLVLAGALYESASGTVAPVAVMRFPLGEGSAVWVSQIGWTSSLTSEWLQDSHWRWTSSLAFTPVRAHLSHDVYDAEGRERQDAFDDTSLRLTSGEVWRSRDVLWDAHLLVQKEWLAQVAPELRASFRAPFVGIESTLMIQKLRSEDPLAVRIEGVRLTARIEGAAGDRRWAEGDVRVSLGARWGVLLPALEAAAFAVSLDHPVTDVVVGGSWDVLGPFALMGYPLGAFRLPRGASLTGRLDLVVLRGLTLGVRESLLAGAVTLHDGMALVMQANVWGIHLFTGAASPAGALWRGDGSRISLFAGVNAALLFAP